MVPDISQRHLLARDGTRIGYQVRGDGPCVVLANGLGASYIAFRYLYDALADYKTVCWDYRGLYTSAAPADATANTMAHHVTDLVEVLEAERVDEFVVVGWSMGVQLALETIKRHRPRVRGLFAINGTYARTFRTVMGSRLVGHTIPMMLRLVRAQAALVGLASRRVAGSHALIAAMKRVGLVSEAVDMELFRVVAGGFQHIDWVVYSDLLTQLDRHDAEDVLATVDVPVAIVTGDRDLIIPPAAAEHMHRTIPGSRMVVIKGGTHYTPCEYPQVLVDELGALLDRVPGWERAGRAA